TLATAGKFDRMAKIWDLEERICLREFLAGSSRINFVVLWRETSLVVADNDAVRCWDLDSNSPLAEDSMAMTSMPVCADRQTGGAYYPQKAVWTERDKDHRVYVSA
ncbi:hypothetical protein FOL47_001569, partial [Perkinsus chesapeaki]